MTTRTNVFKSFFLTQVLLSYVFLVSGLIVNFLQLLLFLTVWPFDKILYRKVMYYLSASLNSSLTALVQWWSGTDLQIYCTDEDLKMFGKENCFGIYNHKYDIDWLMGLVLNQKMGILGGSKAVSKNELKYVPIFGWNLYFSESLFVKRVWEKDRDTLSKDLNCVLNFPKGYHYLLGIVCEGTRFTPQKHEESMKIAREKGLPELKHHLLPRTKGFLLVASQMAHRVDYFYDVNFAMQKVDNHRSPNIFDLMKGRELNAQAYVRRIPIASLPINDDKKCAEYLFKLYKEKDDIHDIFDQTGSFEGVGNGVRKQSTTLNKYDLYVAMGWALAVLIPTLYYLISYFLTGSLLLKCVIISAIAFVNFFVKWLIKNSDSSAGSKYGLNSNGKNGKSH